MNHVESSPSASLVGALSMEGRVALVTGGGRGIGRAIALGFAELGASVAVAARSSSEIAAVRDEIEALGRSSIAVEMDVQDPVAVAEGCARAAAALGPIDTVVNNAGNLLYKPFVPLPGVATDAFPGFERATTDEEWSTTLGTHAYGAFHVLRATVPGMLEARRGRIINVLSNSLVRHVPFVSAYDAAKGALSGLTKSLANELARYGITANAIAPGHFYTALSAPMHDNPDSMRRLLDRIPMRRVGDLAEVAALAAFLASDLAGFVTGQVVVIDGGESL